MGTVFLLSGSGTGSVPSLRHPTMEVVLDSGASHNVLPYEVYEKLLAQGRATKLVPVQTPKRFTTASGESLENYGTTEVLMAGPGPGGKITKCKCNFHVAAVKRCLLSTARAMDKGNCLVFAKQKASLYMPDGGIVEFLVKGSPRATFKVLPLTGSGLPKSGVQGTEERVETTHCGFSESHQRSKYPCGMPRAA